MSVPNIKPIGKQKTYEVKQSKYEFISKLPTRAVLIAPSNSGKTVLLSNLIMDIYRDCFSKIYIFSPSIDIDDAWEPVKNYLKHHLKQDEKKDKYLFDEFDSEAFQKIINTQHKIVQLMKEKQMKHIYQIAIFIDDMLDNQRFLRHTPALDRLFLRGRHDYISTFISIQKYKGISNTIRLNINDLYVFKLRNQSDLDSFLDETSALIDKKTMLQLYHEATDEPYGFLYIKLSSRDLNDMFYASLKRKLIISNV